VNGHQAQSWRQSDFGEHFECGTLVVQQSFRYPEYHADYAITASRATHSAVVAVDHDRSIRVEGPALGVRFAVGRCHQGRPLGLAFPLPER